MSGIKRGREPYAELERSTKMELIMQTTYHDGENNHEE